MKKHLVDQKYHFYSHASEKRIENRFQNLLIVILGKIHIKKMHYDLKMCKIRNKRILDLI